MTDERAWLWCGPCHRLTNGFTSCGHCDEPAERLDHEKARRLIQSMEYMRSLQVQPVRTCPKCRSRGRVAKFRRSTERADRSILSVHPGNVTGPAIEVRECKCW